MPTAIRKRSSSWRRLGQKAPSKYRSRRTTVDGISFHSAKEANRYLDLKLLEKAGLIDALALQPRFELRVMHQLTKRFEVIGAYVADFAYADSRASEYVVEDVKGVDTPLSRWKRKHCEAQYGLKIRIV